MFRFFLLACCLCAALSGLFAQGLVDGFMSGSGRVNLALSYSNEWYDTYFVGTTETTNPNLGEIRTQAVSLYANAGLTDFADLIVTLPYVTAAPNAGYWPRQSGLQDLSLYARLRPVKARLGKAQLDWLLAGGVSTPVGDYIPDAPVAIGHQSTALEASTLLHIKLASGLFATVRGGYIQRRNVELDRGFEVSVPDAWDYAARLGWAAPKWYADVWLQAQDPRSGTDIGPGVPFPSNAIGFTRLGANFAWQLPGLAGFGLTAGGGYTLEGRNTGKSTRLSIGLVYGMHPWRGLGAVN